MGPLWVSVALGLVVDLVGLAVVARFAYARGYQRGWQARGKADEDRMVSALAAEMRDRPPGEQMAAITAATYAHGVPTRSPYFRCPTCGPRVAVDEDGCCRTCGADAVAVSPYPPLGGGDAAGTGR